MNYLFPLTFRPRRSPAACRFQRDGVSSGACENYQQSFINPTGGQSDAKIKTAHKGWAALLQMVRCMSKN